MTTENIFFNEIFNSAEGSGDGGKAGWECSKLNATGGMTIACFYRQNLSN